MSCVGLESWVPLRPPRPPQNSQFDYAQHILWAAGSFVGVGRLKAVALPRYRSGKVYPIAFKPESGGKMIRSCITVGLQSSAEPGRRAFR